MMPSLRLGLAACARDRVFGSGGTLRVCAEWASVGWLAGWLALAVLCSEKAAKVEPEDFIPFGSGPREDVANDE